MGGTFKKIRNQNDALRRQENIQNFNPLTGKVMNLWRPSEKDLEYMMGVKNGTIEYYPNTLLGQTETTVANTDANKGATDLQKLAQGRKERENAYGKTQVFVPDSYIMEDTTLASGSLLNLGSRLG